MQAVFLFLGIVASGILTILGIIFTAIGFAFSKSSRFIWLAVFVVSMLCLLVLVYYTTVKTTEAAKEFQKSFQKSVINTYDPDAADDYHFADSVHSMQVQLIKAYEPAGLKGKVPGQFYHYLGFADYFRLPLTYPYSIHCNDLPESGTLFNEENVENFSENDNGEKDCGITNIIAFDYNQNVMLAELIAEPGKEKTWLIYELKSGKPRWFESKESMEETAVKEGFGRKPRLITCSDYFNRILSVR